MTSPLRDLDRAYHRMPHGSMEHLFDADRMHREHYWSNTEAARAVVLIRDGHMWDPIYTRLDIWETR